MASAKWMTALIYTLAYAFVFMSVASQLALSPPGQRLLAVLAVSYTVGLLAILAWPLIMPYIVPALRICGKRIVAGMYVVGQRGPTYVVDAYLKLIPQTAVIDMGREEHEALLHTMASLLSSSTFEAMLAFMTMRDTYAFDVVERLRREKARLLAFSKSEYARDAAARLDREISRLSQSRAIITGFYFIRVRDYGRDLAAVLERMRGHVEAVKNMVSAVGLRAEPIKGAELVQFIRYLEYGRVEQATA